MKTYLFIISFLLLSCLASGQSLLKVDNFKNLSGESLIDSLQKYIVSNIQTSPSELMKLVDFYISKAEPLGKKEDIYIGYYWKGMLHEMLGEFPQALKWDFKALNLAESLKSESRIASCNLSIGLVYFSQTTGKEKSLPFFRKHLAIYSKLNNKEEMIGSLINIGLVHKLASNIDSAIFYHRKALQLSKQVDNKYHISSVYANMGDNYRYVKNWDSATYYYSLNEKYCLEQGFYFDLAELFYSRAFMEYDRGDNESSIVFLEKAIQLADSLNLKNNLMKYYDAQSEVLFLLGRYKEAYLSRLNYSTLSDSLNNDKNMKELARLQTLYEVALKEKELNESRAKAKYQEQRITILGLIFGSSIIIFVLIIAFIVNKRKKDKILMASEKALAIVELEKSKMAQADLEQQLEFKNRQLTSHALNMMQKNKILLELQDKIESLGKKPSTQQGDEIRAVKNEINSYLRSEKDWDVFKMYFEQVNQDFFVKLDQLAPDLGQSDYRLCALIKLNMNIKESAAVLNIAPNSIKSARYRLRKKLNLNSEDDLYDFLKKL